MRLYTITLYDLGEQLIQFGQNFDCKIRRDYEKISYERRAYEAVDNRSLS